jgi:CheY-like chemotaxis protein
MDGLEATRRIRSEEKDNGGHMSIIALTADTTLDARHACLDAGMDDFLNKPIEPATMYGRVKYWLEATEARVSDVNERESSRIIQPIDALSAPPRSEALSSVLLDHSSLRQIRQMQRADQPDLVKRVIDVYLCATPDLLTRLAAAVTIRDPSAIRVNAHALKSSSAHLGAFSLAALAKEMENKGCNKDLDAVESLQQEIQITFNALEKELRRFDDIAA